LKNKKLLLSPKILNFVNSFFLFISQKFFLYKYFYKQKVLILYLNFVSIASHFVDFIF